MLRSKRLLTITPRNFKAIGLPNEDKLFPAIPLHNPSQLVSTRFLDFYQLGSKEAIEKERARLKDEMSRGYFADIKEMNEHGGKLAVANKIIIPAIAALKFPTLEVNFPDGSICKLPITSQGNDAKTSTENIPKVSILCLSFRASSQNMIESWSLPFLKTFGRSSDIKLYEGCKMTQEIKFYDTIVNELDNPLPKIVQNYVSFIDSWLLTRSPIKKLLLKVMKKSPLGEKPDVLQRQTVYSFGDHYYLRKELRILNLLTGYIFLVDKLGRIRWQGSGLATENELSSLLFCTSMLMDEK